MIAVVAFLVVATAHVVVVVVDVEDVASARILELLMLRLVYCCCHRHCCSCVEVVAFVRTGILRRLMLRNCC